MQETLGLYFGQSLVTEPGRGQPLEPNQQGGAPRETGVGHYYPQSLQSLLVAANNEPGEKSNKIAQNTVFLMTILRLGTLTCRKSKGGKMNEPFIRGAN